MKSEFLDVKEYVRCWKRLKSIECKAFSWDSCRILCKATVRILQIVHLLRIERWLQEGEFCQRWAECTQLRSSSNAEASKFPPPPLSLSLLPCASLSFSCSHAQHCLLLTMTLLFPKPCVGAGRGILNFKLEQQKGQGQNLQGKISRVYPPRVWLTATKPGEASIHISCPACSRGYDPIPALHRPDLGAPSCHQISRLCTGD